VLNKKRFEKVLDGLGRGLQRTTSEWEKFEQVKDKKKKTYEKKKHLEYHFRL
jgi:hypothetical protein